VVNRGRGIYIGRSSRYRAGSVLGNPYFLGKDGNREQVCDKYEAWIYEEYSKRGGVYNELHRLVRKVREEGELTLTCFCAPERCHGDMVSQAILNLADKE
jgi:hypothetical protein